MEFNFKVEHVKKVLTFFLPVLSDRMSMCVVVIGTKLSTPSLKKLDRK